MADQESRLKNEEGCCVQMMCESKFRFVSIGTKKPPAFQQGVKGSGERGKA